MSRMGTALMVSLALNLFLAGVLIGDRLAQWRDPVPTVAGPLLGGLGLRGASLAPEARQELRRVLESYRRPLHERMRDLQESRLTAARALAAEPYDPKRAEAALAELRRRTRSAQAVVHGALVEAAASLEAEHRAQLLDRHGRRGRGEDAGGDPGSPPANR